MRAWAWAAMGDALRVLALLCLGVGPGKRGFASLDTLVLQMPLPAQCQRKGSPTLNKRGARRPLHQRYFAFCLALTTLSLALLTAASHQIRGHWGLHAFAASSRPARRTVGPTIVPSLYDPLLDELSAALAPASVARAIDLREQLLLVLRVPPLASPQNRSLRAVYDALVASSAPLPAALPLACVISAGTNEEEALGVRGFAATDTAAFVRCHLPKRQHAAEAPVTLALYGIPGRERTGKAGDSGRSPPGRSGLLEAALSADTMQAGASVETTQARATGDALYNSAHRTAGADCSGHNSSLPSGRAHGFDEKREVMEPEMVQQAHTPARDPGSSGYSQAGPTSSPIAREGAGRQGTFLRSQAKLDTGVPSGSSMERLVMESSLQAEGIHVFQKGLTWETQAPRCIYAPFAPHLNASADFSLPTLIWKARAVRARPKESTVICPHVPKATLSHWRTLLEGTQRQAGARSMAEGAGSAVPLSSAADGDRLQRVPEQGSIRSEWLVGVTLEDWAGPLPSVAHFDPSEGVPASWRKGPVHSACAQAKGAETTPKPPKEFHLCSCTMAWDSAHLLEEWALYHSWMGVDHFFVYDNNSDDNLQALAPSLSSALRRAVPLGGAILSNPEQEAGAVRMGQQRDVAAQTLGTGDVRRTAGHEALFRNWTTSKPVRISIRPWPWLKSQEHAFAHCMLQAAPRCDWVMFTDVDEFIFPSLAKGLNSAASLAQKRAEAGPFLHAWIRDAESRVCPRKTGQLVVGSLNMVASGWTRHPAAGVSPSYVCRKRKETLGKAVVRPEFATLGIQHRVHDFKGSSQLITNSVGAILYHFKYQAWEEYKKKFTRRASAAVEDWLAAASLLGGAEDGRLVRVEDGVEIQNGEPIPPRDWPTRGCQVHDQQLATFVELIFGSRARFGVEFPWQNSTPDSKRTAQA